TDHTVTTPKSASTGFEESSLCGAMRCLRASDGQWRVYLGYHGDAAGRRHEWRCGARRRRVATPSTDGITDDTLPTIEAFIRQTRDAQLGRTSGSTTSCNASTRSRNRDPDQQRWHLNRRDIIATSPNRSYYVDCWTRHKSQKSARPRGPLTSIQATLPLEHSDHR